MRTKCTVFLILSIFIASAIIISAIIASQPEKNKQTESDFSLMDCLDNFKWEIENTRCDGNYKNQGNIADFDSAVSAARRLWKEEIDKISIYSGEYALSYQDEIAVAYDRKEDCWHIYEILPDGVDGVGRHALIKSDGEVVAVWVG